VRQTTAERFWDWATSASMSCFEASASMVNVDLDVVEAVADVAVDTEDSADVVLCLRPVALDRAQLDAAILCDGTPTACREAAGQTDKKVFDRRDAVVLCREDLGVVGVEHRFGLVALLLPRDRRSFWIVTVSCGRRLWPLGGCPPG